MKSTERTDFRTMRRRCAFGSVRYNVSRKVDGIVGREHRGTKGDCRVPRSVRAVVSSDEVKGKCLDNKNNLLHPDSVRNSSCVSRLLLAKVLKMERFKPLLTYIENIRPMRRSDENIEANRLSMPARNHWLLLSGTMTEMQG
ncbi:uncharacterized protein LOC143895897 isoform X1 [Temnothorax americanus]|uniref:uncharacterized protein LOC143895897 isoform X1 n=1 Tax=Temnothorax americanus TaxID=1964332 RepID=UPI0040685EF8